MNDRSAVDTIKGYFYQFDLTIKNVLSLQDDSSFIDIECIEDIDIHTATETTATQCKYYAKTEYNHSVIKPAVMHMVSHYKNNVISGISPSINYHIYGHYSSGQDKLPTFIDIDFLKDNFLTYTKSKKLHYHHIELGLSDVQLNDFLSRFKIDNNSMSFEDQFQYIIKKLTIQFNCTEFEAEYFYYNNALRIIKDKSTKQLSSDRRLFRQNFLGSIDTSRILFNIWFISKKGKQAHLRNLRSAYFSSLNVPNINRFFLIDASDQSIQIHQIVDAVCIIQKKWSKISKIEPTPFCPFIYIHGLSDDNLLILKGILYTKIKFIDGFSYYGATFDPLSLLAEPTLQNMIKLKFIHAPNHIEQVISCTKNVNHIFQFHINNTYFDYADNLTKHTKIQISSIDDIKEIV